MTRKRNNWALPAGAPITEFDQRILEAQAKGHIVPTRSLVKTPEQIAGIRRAGVINTAILDMLTDHIREGITTGEIDRLVAEFTESHGAICAPYGYEGFPAHCCTSIGDVVCHGIPSDDEELYDGDIINVDVTTILDGYYADASRMYCVGKIEPDVQRLVDVARECMEIGIEAARPWHYVGEIGKAIGRHAHKNGFFVVRDLCGHGTGNAFHEDPEVDHYDTHRRGMLLVPGMVITVEPMLCMKSWEVVGDEEDETGWIELTEDGEPSAQWEHTILITEDGHEVLTH